MILTMRATTVRFRKPAGGITSGERSLVCKLRGSPQLWALGPDGWVKITPSPLGTKGAYWQTVEDRG